MNLGGRLLAPFARRDNYRVLVHLSLAAPLGAAALAVLIAGWVTTAVLAITPLVVVALVGFRAAVGGLALLEAALARELLGAATYARTSSGGRGFWRRGLNVLRDGAFWRQQAYLTLRWLVGFPLAVFELSLIAGSIGAIALPIYYRWSDLQIGDGWPVDTLGRALLFVPAGMVGLLLAGHVLRPLGALSRRLALALLSSDAIPVHSEPALARARRRHALALHGALFAGLNGLFVLIWAITSRGYFWPVWPLIVLAMPLTVHAWVELLAERPEIFRAQRITYALGVQEGVSATLFLFFVAVWALTSGGYFWPVWPLIGLAIALAVHAIVVYSRRLGSEQLTQRIETLEQTRAGAVNAQETELRRIERDLHDGAQARLVALGMSIGLAEQKLATDPDSARELLAETRRGMLEALEELRDLARGIHPPVLTDRGLEAAVSTLADRSPLPVRVGVELDERPPALVETAAYFVVAEALANATKHALATGVNVRIRMRDSRLLVEVDDDGRGGADSSGNGLTGLKRRVEALDGTLAITSPRGGPTTIQAELPCAS
ncbi:MAG TPA: sensor domain-containing protein [Gaiellaceae bacterium]|nr:sensor domain-containing protein [Gaiellaceae bacterium]